MHSAHIYRSGCRARWRHSVVVAGMEGLLSGRVLASYFDRVGPRRAHGRAASAVARLRSSPEDGVYSRQRRLLESSEEGFIGQGFFPGELFETGSCGGEQTLSGEATARERFGTEAGCLVAVLVGKDGAVKHRSDKPMEPKGLRSHRHILRSKEGDVREGRPGLAVRSDVTVSGLVRIPGWITSHGVPGTGCRQKDVSCLTL